VKYFDGWATVILPIHETMQPNHKFGAQIPRTSVEENTKILYDMPHSFLVSHQLHINGIR